MRFRFFQPTDEDETSAHLEQLSRLEAFWRDAVAELRVPRRNSSETIRLQEALGLALGRVDPDLIVELEPASTKLRVVLASKSDPALSPLVDELLARAPRMTGIDFLGRWPASSAPDVVDAVRRRYDLDLTDAQARAGFSRGHLLEVVVYCSDFHSATDAKAMDAAQFAVTRLLGEELFDDWVSAVEVSPMPRSSSLRVLSESGDARLERFSLTELPEVVNRAIAGLRQGLASAPYHTFCEHAEWTLLESEPEPSEDYADLDDLALCATMLPEMAKCFLQGEPFSSTRFSNEGEVFCCLKIDGAGTTDEQRFEKRLELEESLNRALVPGRVGCVVGAGLGLRYVYLLLALSNLDAGLEITRKVAQRADVPLRSWIRFCDSVWRYEWVGIWNETPPPP